MQNARLVEEQARIKIAGINNLRYAEDTTLTAECEEEVKNILIRVKEESERLKAQHSKAKNMASGPITSWQIEEGKLEAGTDFILGAPKSL